jgi:hypothetical protein
MTTKLLTTVAVAAMSLAMLTPTMASATNYVCELTHEAPTWTAALHP